MHTDPVLNAMLTPWGRRAPVTDQEMDGLIDHFAALKERNPRDTRIDSILREIGRLLRQNAELTLAATVH